MLETLLAFLGTMGGKATVVSLGIYLLSLLSNSEGYKKAREAVGRSGEAVGAAMSALGTSRLGFLWNPTELVFADFVLLFWERFGVGLRKDNKEKMERQLERLESVGSVTQAGAIAEKLKKFEAAQEPIRDKNDAEVMAQAVAAAEAGNQERLKG